jgi:starch synthase (maltosyl-transferring)
MALSAHIIQSPGTGDRRLFFRGDQVIFRLDVRPPSDGRAFVRTNLGHADALRKEIIDQVERNIPRMSRDWFDIAMTPTGPGRFEAVIGLDEVGHFEAKCLFLPEGSDEPIWPDGPNTSINVEPADTCCANIIYNAFVRQFGPNKNGSRAKAPPDPQAVETLDRRGYTVIPPSGTFRDLIAELDFIMDRLGCRIVQLLPIHPTPTTYGRMGRFGSPYAALSFTEVDPALAVFDPKATPLEQFLELVDAVHARSGKIIIDIAINHTGWAARLHESHPQWLARNDKGEIQNPGAWGIVWEDLTHLDYRHKELWCYMADVLLTWCRRGVDGFRCDAGYMIPVQAWQYMIAKVREQFPDIIFFLEGLGGKISVTRELLNKANFNWAYSELFQNYDRGQIGHYLPGAYEIAACDGITVHFAETHDNNRLAATSATYARMRTALCALLAPNGGFAFANGVEWFATQKINVHDACSLNWGARSSQVDDIARLSRLLKSHPAFGPDVALDLIDRGEGNFIALLRRHQTTGRRVLVLANLDCQQPVTAGWDRSRAEWDNQPAVDLLTETPVDIQSTPQGLAVSLAPGQVICLADGDDETLAGRLDAADRVPPAAIRQLARAKALEVLRFFRHTESLDLEQASRELRADPEKFCRRLNAQSQEPRVILWEHPTDLRRHVMIPPGHFVLFRANHHFKVRVVEQDRVLSMETSINDDQGRPFVLLRPLPAGKHDCHSLRRIQLRVYAPQGTEHAESSLLYLCDSCRIHIKTVFSRDDCCRVPLLTLGTNGRGAMMRVRGDWRELASRYDALLAANLNPEFPEDRRVLLTRCRGWIVYQGYSHEINLDGLQRFAFDYQAGGRWDYQIPTGQGEHIGLRITISMPADPANTVALNFKRLESRPGQDELDDTVGVTLIIRPDIEDRNFHQTTKAFSGPERHWPAAVTPAVDGFEFRPDPGYCLVARIDHGRFVSEPEWYYMVHRSQDAERGLDPDSDLFSPGYFSSALLGGREVTLTAQAVIGDPPEPQKKISIPVFEDELDEGPPLSLSLAAALDQYVVRRGAFRTVIAGLPWFLDWGRDTLIVARGLVAARKLDTVKAILMQFARFEQRGTLPNMIRGEDAGNRDTSDAPLWFFTVCADLAAATGRSDFLKTDCNGRTLKKVLTDLATALISGTPNGVAMDPESGLIFSPSHFTWMDTNYPAGTPRQGYPIEIQALWFAALQFLARIDSPQKKKWRTLGDQVSANIVKLFWLPDLGYLVDCRHAQSGQPATQAAPDDALRPNQLLAVTLGAVADKAICRRILSACQSLLVPGAIRSLADRPVKIPIDVRHDGRLLNNPHAPYWGTYTGDEDTRRKPAYHNGTAWTWPFPSFCEAWADTYGQAGIPAALAWLSSGIGLINGHCVGHVPEIVDGDAPHTQRGCDAQAWGVSELLRVWIKLNTENLIKPDI